MLHLSRRVDCASILSLLPKRRVLCWTHLALEKTKISGVQVSLRQCSQGGRCKEASEETTPWSNYVEQLLILSRKMRTKSMILISMSLSTAVLRGFTTLTSRFTSYLSRITKKQKLANNVKWTSQEPYQLLLGTYVSCTRSDTCTRWKTLVTVKSTAIHPNANKESQAVLMPNQRALWANSWIDRWLTWFFGLCLMLSGLGNFVVDCHI